MRRLLMAVLLASSLSGCGLLLPTYAYLDPDDPTVQQLLVINEQDSQAAAKAFEGVLASQGISAKVDRIETKVNEVTGAVEEVRAVVGPERVDATPGGASIFTTLIPDPALRTLVEGLMSLLAGGALWTKTSQTIRKKYPKKPKK